MEKTVDLGKFIGYSKQDSKPVYEIPKVYDPLNGEFLYDGYSPTLNKKLYSFQITLIKDFYWGIL